jgi:hypothetical protein
MNKRNPKGNGHEIDIDSVLHTSFGRKIIFKNDGPTLCTCFLATPWATTTKISYVYPQLDC